MAKPAKHHPKRVKLMSACSACSAGEPGTHISCGTVTSRHLFNEAQVKSWIKKHNKGPGNH